MNFGAYFDAIAEHGPLLRDYLVPLLAFAAAVALPMASITALFLIVGQAHFFMAFWYQHKGGKITRAYVAVAILLALVAVLYFMYIGAYIPVFLVSGMAFGLHFAVDEFFLHKERVTPERYTTLFSFGLLYAALLLQVLGPKYVFLAVAAFVFLLAHVIVRYGTGHALTRAEQYLALVGCVLFVLAIVFQLWEQILSVVILLHCSNWIIGYGQKVHSVPPARAAYWKATILTLLLSSSLYAVWVYGHGTMLAFLFLPTYWYVWALAHFVLSSHWLVGAKRPIG